jgi:hypothetical protein
MNNLRKALWLLRGGHYRLLAALLRRWVWDDGSAIALAYSLDQPVRARVPRTAMTMRLLEPAEVPLFTALSPGLAPEEALVRTNARHLLSSPLEPPYVGVTEAGPVYLQYLLTAEQNETSREVFGGLFPALAPREGLLEFAYTREPYRGTAVMPTGLLLLMEIARDRGLERLVTVVSTEQASFVRFLTAIGFAPYALRHERRRLLRRRIRFEPVAAEPVAPPPPARGGAVRRWGVRAAVALMLAEAVTQLVNFGVFDLRLTALDSRTHASVFGVLSVLALAAAAAAALAHGRDGLGLAAALGLLLALRVTHAPHVLVYALPVTAAAFVLLWRTARADAGLHRLVRVACGFLVVSFAVHGPGELVVQHFGLASDTWAYELKVVVKHALELGGWVLVATALAALRVERKPLFARGQKAPAARSLAA